MESNRVRYGLVALTVTLLVAAAGATPAAANGDASPELLVELQADGDADVTLTMTFDLDSDDERDAFRSLENDEQARADARQRFGDRMAAVAASAANETGREMSVTDATIVVSTSDDGHVGVVSLGVTWRNLAATGDGRLVVTEPFASGYQPDRPFTVRGPDGYELAEVTPAADGEGPNAATWESGADLSGFRASFAPAPGGDGGSSAGSDGGSDELVPGAPGFGAGAALAALAGTVALVVRRR